MWNIEDKLTKYIRGSHVFIIRKSNFLNYSVSEKMRLIIMLNLLIYLNIYNNFYKYIFVEKKLMLKYKWI